MLLIVTVGSVTVNYVGGLGFSERTVIVLEQKQVLLIKETKSHQSLRYELFHCKKLKDFLNILKG